MLTLVCLAIPATSLITFIIASAPNWSSTEAGNLMVEVIAVVFAFVFWRAANKAKSRAYFGERNSIWAINLPQNKGLESAIAGSTS